MWAQACTTIVSSLRDEEQEVPLAQPFRHMRNDSTEVRELLCSENNFDILDVSNHGKSQRDWAVRAEFKSLRGDLKFYTVAQANLLLLECYLKMRPKPPLNPSSTVLRSYQKFHNVEELEVCNVLIEVE
ncbi:hypothetical protein MTO96_008210 [Rhipicephalus appendiculatus]